LLTDKNENEMTPLPNFCLGTTSFEMFGASMVFHSLVNAGAISNRDAVSVFVQGHATWTVASLDADGIAPTIQIDIFTRSGARVTALLVRLPKGTFDSYVT
jgi:hypothetical protein